MKQMLILGAGQVGQTLASALVRDGHDVTVVDIACDRLEAMESFLDIKTVCGQASRPDILKTAGAEQTEMLIAVTDSDEVNLLACQVAHAIFGVRNLTARVRERCYHDAKGLLGMDAVPPIFPISPETIVTDHIRRLIEYPGALYIVDFAEGMVSLVGVRANYGGALVGHQLRNLTRDIPGIQTRVAAIFRRQKAIRPDGHTVVEAGDEVFFVAARKNIRAVMSELRKLEKSYGKILVAGGGNVGKHLAQVLASRYQVTLIERNPERIEYLKKHLPGEVRLLAGDSADDRFLDRSELSGFDVFCAVTDDDQSNIFSGMLAKQRGIRKVIALINREGYEDLVHDGAIDIVVSPQQVTVGVLLAKVRAGTTAMVHSIHHGAAEAIETVLTGRGAQARLIQRRIEEIRMPREAAFGALVRDKEVIIPHHDTVLREGDHVILFLSDRKRLPAIQRLFDDSPRWWQKHPLA